MLKTKKRRCHRAQESGRQGRKTVAFVLSNGVGMSQIQETIGTPEPVPVYTGAGLQGTGALL